MKPLNYLDYVKTPDDWKRRAIDIPNQVQVTKPHRRFKPSALVLACILVVSLSGGAVYAYNYGSLDVIKSKLFSDRYTHYSYEGTYNDTIELSDLEEYLNTNPKVEDLTLSGDVEDFKVTGYICDREKCMMVAQITLPEDSTFTPTVNSTNFDPDKLETICLDPNGEESSDTMVYSSCIRIERVEGNTVYVSMELNTYDYVSSGAPDLDGHSYRVSFGDFGTWKYDDGSYFDVEDEFDVSFDITVEDSGMCNYVDNVDREVTLKNGTTTTIRSIDYSPLRININFDTTTFDEQYIEYYGSESRIANQFAIYYIYGDGRRVFVDRSDLWYSLQDTEDGKGCVSSLYVDYDWNYTKLVDFTNVVAIEVNGEVISLR